MKPEAAHSGLSNFPKGTRDHGFLIYDADTGEVVHGHWAILLPDDQTDIETLERTWDPENGTMYHISARLLDTTLSQHEIYLRPAYFVVPHGDEPWRLNPAYFAAQPPAKP